MSSDIPETRGRPPPLSGGPVRFGAYFLEARLAVGGTSEVYLARRADSLHRADWVVVKRLLPHIVADPEGRQMFEREAALQAAISHPNVVRVHETGNVDGEPFLAMERVDGVDCYRLLRKTAQLGQKLPNYVAIHVIRQILIGLSAVHTATDENGQLLGIVHRDVSPSNIYLGLDGSVKLGDFGVARASSRASLRTAGPHVLRGKFAYLAPEQVAGEPFDHRADLFSVGTVLAEMLMGKPLFSGTGQLAILLAIRDCNLAALLDERDSILPGVMTVLMRALAREPSERFATAEEFASALAEYDDSSDAARAEVGALVRLTRASASMESLPVASIPSSASRQHAALQATSSARPEGAITQRPKPPEGGVPQSHAFSNRPGQPRSITELASWRPSDLDAPESGSFSERTTGEYTQVPSFVTTTSGQRMGPWQFARLVEAIATGEVAPLDLVEYVGNPPQPLETIDDLVRFLPPKSGTIDPIPGSGGVEVRDSISTLSLLNVLLRVLEHGESGVLLASRANDRKEIYFRKGKLHHVASSNAEELFGKYLARRGMITSEELDFALAVLPRYQGRMGDTLISLGLLSPMEIFRAIRDQGRDRLADLFSWRSGEIGYHITDTVPVVEFSLDLDIGPLILSGMAVGRPGDTPAQAYRPYMDNVVTPHPTPRRKLLEVPWPPVIARVLQTVSEPSTVRAVLLLCGRGGQFHANDILRALEVLLAARLLTWA